MDLLALPRKIDGPTPMPRSVRLAGAADEARLLELLVADIAENAGHIAPASVPTLLQQIQVCTRARGGFCPVVDGADGNPVGLALLVPTQWWWSDQFFLSEIVMFVHPKARHSRCGAALLTAEKALADNMSKTLGHRIYLLAGVTATQRGQAKLRLYGRHLNPVGGFFVYPSVELNVGGT